MNYLVSAVKFSIKNWMLILPLFILMALAALIGGVGSALSLGTITSLMNTGNYTDPSAIIAMLPAIFAAVAGGGVVSFLAPFIYQPATYGMVNKSLETGNAGLNDLGAAISGNFVKYLLYLVGQIIVYLACGIATFLLVLLLSLITSILGAIGVVLMVIVIIALVLFFLALGVLLSMWFAAMVVDGLDVVAAAKKSIEVVKSCFWTVFGITILVGVAAAIVGGILSFLNMIPLIGPIIYSVVPAAQAFVMIVFGLTLYREKTGRVNAA